MGSSTQTKNSQQPESASRTLENTKSLLNQIEALGGIGHWEINLKTGNTSCSDQFYKILGLDQNEVEPSFDLVLLVVHPADRELARVQYMDSMTNGHSFKIENRIVHPDGKITFVVSKGIVELGQDGKPVRLLGIFKDITQEKAKEEELSRTNIQIENILNTTQDLVFLAEESGSFRKVSKSCTKILGYLPHELIGKSFRDLIHPDDYQATVDNREEVLAGKASSDFKNRYFKKDGSIITLNWSASLDTTTNTVFGIARDITILLQTQEKLKKDRQKLAIVLDSSPETIWALDRNYCLITANNKFLRTMKEIGNWDVNLGENLIYDTPLPTHFLQSWKKCYDRALLGESFSAIHKITLMKVGGYLQINYKPIYEGRKIVAVGCYSLDITRQIEDDQRKKELLERLNLAQKIGKMGYWELDIETKKIYWSDEVYSIWGIDQLLFEPHYETYIETIHPEDKDVFLKNHTDALNGLVPLDTVHRIILQSSEVKWVHEKGELEKDPNTGTTTFRGTVRDITVEKTYEKELIERNKFIEAALHNLPSGIAVNKISTGEATYINPAFSKIYGWPTEVMINIRAFFEKIYPDPLHRAKITSKIIADIQSGNPVQMNWQNIQIVTQNGEERIVSAKNIPLPNQDLMISTVVDETATYWSNHSLRVSNERFHLATQAVSDAIWDWDIRKNSIFLGKGYQRLFGFPEEMQEISPGLAKDRIHPEDYPPIFKSIKATRNDKTKNRWSGEYRFRKFDETYTFVQENLIIIRDLEGNPIRMVGSLKDISAEKQKELQLCKKTNFIATISQITQSFFENEDWFSLISPTLKRIGEIAGVDRTYFFKNFTDPKTGGTYTQQIDEWTNGNVSVEIDNQNYQAIPFEEYPITLSQILKGKPFFILTKNSEGSLQNILQEQGIKSILIMPIFVNEQFCGFIGLDDCTTERIWSEDEISFLASVTTNLSLAIDRKNNLDKIREAFVSRDALLESIGDSFYALDTNYKVTYWNNMVEKLTGVKREAIVGQNIWGFVGGVNQQFKTAYEVVFKENKIQHFETFDEWVNAWLEVTIYPSDGGLSVIIRDISQRKDSERQIQEFNERFSLISQASQDAIWDWNIATGEHYWGEGFNVLFGEEIAGIHQNYDRWKNNIHPDDQQRILKLYTELLNTPSETFFEAEYRFIKKSGEMKYLLDKATILRDASGKATRAVGAIQDITSRKSYEVSLKNLNAELAQTNTKLEISNQELEQFAYVASHDLQEPLRMISSFLGLLERRYTSILDEKGHQYIHFAVDGAKRMKEIILDLLEFSKLGKASGNKIPCITPNLMQEVLLLNSKLIKEKNAVIHIGTLPDITCQPSQIIQVFQNLLGNGLKYQRPGSIPEIWIEGWEMESEWRFSVKDNGIGIDSEYQEKIFIIFQRLHLKEQYSGSGIGLALCKKIVEFHGGKIWVESTLGAGSVFYFTLKK